MAHGRLTDYPRLVLADEEPDTFTGLTGVPELKEHWKGCEHGKAEN